jgi:hypothetical protein
MLHRRVCQEVCVSFFPLVRKPVGKLDSKAIECRFPVMDWHGPLLGNIPQSEIDHFVDGLIRRKNPMIARHLAQGHVHRLNRVGRVDNPTNVL